ncbi:MAG: hypothetical protein M1838_000805 [Thelocarpon superellum]|nr:MAG: hypothetical protein M1838_000805 [Thelocarpon superellum]
MGFLFTTSDGRRAPNKTLTVDVYASKLKQGLLSPGTKSLGFKTFVEKSPTSPFFLDEDRYLEAFHAEWESAVKEVAPTFGFTLDEAWQALDHDSPASSPSSTSELDTPVEALSLLDPVVANSEPHVNAQVNDFAAAISRALHQSAVTKSFAAVAEAEPHIVEVNDFTASIGRALHQSIETKSFTPVQSMATRPTLKVHDLPTAKAETVSPASAITPSSAMSPGSVDRAERKRMVLSKLREDAYPLRHEWVFWHERHDHDARSPIVGKTGAAPAYEETLVQLMTASTVKKFWETTNNFDIATMKLRDSFHLFKKTVKPVWEDPRNVRGGSWTFRLNKSMSAQAWTRVQLMAIGEALQDVVEAGDDICGVSISVRFNSHLVSVWNRDGANQTSVDAIKAKVLEELPEELRPTPNNIYYKKHSEHTGFSEAVAASKAKAEAETGGAGHLVTTTIETVPEE